MAWRAEYTDTFGGEANYSWLRRAELDKLPDNATPRQVARAAKAAFGLSGMRGRSEWTGDMYAFYPAAECTVVFATWGDA